MDEATRAAFQAAVSWVFVGVLFICAVSIIIRTARPRLQGPRGALPSLNAERNKENDLGISFVHLSWSPDVRDDRTTMTIFQGKAMSDPIASVSGSLLSGNALVYRSVGSGVWTSVRRSSHGLEIHASEHPDALYAEVWRVGREQWSVDGLQMSIFGSFINPDFLCGQQFIKMYDMHNTPVAQVEVSNDERGRSFHASVISSADPALVAACLVSLSELEALQLHAI